MNMKGWIMQHPCTKLKSKTAYARQVTQYRYIDHTHKEWVRYAR